MSILRGRVDTASILQTAGGLCAAGGTVLALAACLCLLSGCIGDQLHLLSDRFGTSFDFEAESGPDLVIIDLRLCRTGAAQQCGPAALTTVWRHYANWSDPDAKDALARLCGTRKGPWTLGELESVSREAGYEAVTARADLAQVREWVDKGWPPLVALRGVESDGHLCVVAGYHRTKGYFVLADPQAGFRKYSEGRFLRRWELTGRACVLVLPKAGVSDG